MNRFNNGVLPILSSWCSTQALISSVLESFVGGVGAFSTTGFCTVVFSNVVMPCVKPCDEVLSDPGSFVIAAQVGLLPLCGWSWAGS